MYRPFPSPATPTTLMLEITVGWAGLTGAVAPAILAFEAHRSSQRGRAVFATS